MKRIIFYALLLLTIVSCMNSSNKKTVLTTSVTADDFTQILNWPALPDSFVLGTPPSIGIDSHQNIFVFQRAKAGAVLSPDGLIQENTVIVLDHETGKLLASWGSNQFKKPHGLTVDQNNNIWLTDVELQQIFKFSPNGQLLMTLGEKDVPGLDSSHFDQPTDVDVAPDGSFYVTDGYGNSRVVKFAADGKYLMEWGTAGIEDGKFNLPHAMDIDQSRNVYVADRENQRVQEFDENGSFLKLWADPSFGSIQSMCVSPDGNTIYATDYKWKEDETPIGSDIIIIDAKTGQFSKIKKSDDPAIPPSRYHDIAIDHDGNLFVVDILQNRIVRFDRKKD